MNTKFFATILLAAGMFALPVSVMAEGISSSYTQKKQGYVPFKTKNETALEDAASYAETTDPAKIEPQAGDMETDAEGDEESSLSEKMRLPRKN